MSKKKHMKKRGIEMSLNFLVTIIIAITIFIFGIQFIYNLASDATELEEISLDQLDDRIGSLLCDSTDKVCIGIDKKTVRKGDFAVYGIKITNIQDTQNFDITVSRPSPSGYTKNNNPIGSDELDWKPATRSVTIQRNKEAEVGIGIQVPKDAQAGTYIFDVQVMPYDTLHKIYVEVP